MAKIKNETSLNKTETQTVNEDCYSSIDIAFEKMTQIQKDINIKKITELESTLSKLKIELDNIIEENCSANSN